MFNELNLWKFIYKMIHFIMNFIYNKFFFWHNEESYDQVTDQWFQKAVPIKKKEKKTLETFLEKSTCPKTQITYPFSSTPNFQQVQEAVLIKKKKKEMLKMFSEKPTYPSNPKVHLPFPIFYF